MKSRFHFITGFILGAIIFGSSAAIASTIQANAIINTIIVNGKETRMSSYNIKDNNYFKLRDLGEVIGFSVDWDSQRNAIIIDTGQPYPVEITSLSPAAVSPSAPETAMTIDEMKAEIVRLTNEERKKAGVPELKTLPELMDSAQLKADDMKKNNYYGHKSPVYGTAGEMIKSLIPKARSASEVIAPWSKTPSEAFAGWIESPAHYASIIDTKHTHVGVGIIEGLNGGYWWVQQFISLES